MPLPTLKSSTIRRCGTKCAGAVLQVVWVGLRGGGIPRWRLVTWCTVTVWLVGLGSPRLQPLPAPPHNRTAAAVPHTEHVLTH